MKSSFSFFSAFLLILLCVASAANATSITVNVAPGESIDTVLQDAEAQDGVTEAILSLEPGNRTDVAIKTDDYPSLRALTIECNGSRGNCVLQGNGAAPVFYLNDFHGNLSATMKNLVLSGTTGGYAITMNERPTTDATFLSVTLDSTTISNYIRGIGNSRGTLNLVNRCIISGNTGGTGIWNQGGTLNIGDDTIISGNTGSQGGGIYSQLGIINIGDRCIISGNSAFMQGGGIYNYGGTLHIGDSVIISDNKANEGAGIYVAGQAAINIGDGTIISENSGNTGAGIRFSGYITLTLVGDITVCANSYPNSNPHPHQVLLSGPLVGSDNLIISETCPQAHVKFMACSPNPSRFFVTGSNIEGGNEYHLPYDGRGNDGKLTRAVAGNGMVLPVSGVYSLKRAAMNDPGMNCAEVCGLTADGIWVRLAYSVGDYEEDPSTSMEPTVLTFDVGDIEEPHSDACRINARSCLDIGLEMNAYN